MQQQENRISSLNAQMADMKEEIVTKSRACELSDKKLDDINSELNKALSDRLELEAKVSSATDERKTLMERCLEAEAELERSRGSVLELRRKLDDSQAALHELGRENQSIQVCHRKHARLY